MGLMLAAFFYVAQPAASTNMLQSDLGFQDKEAYVDSLTSFYESMGVNTTEDQIIKQAVKIKMFSQEAKSIGLEPKAVNVSGWNHDAADPVNEELIEDIGLAEAFMEYVINNYHVDDIVIKSYYRSNPLRFQKDLQNNSDLNLLDDEFKQSIRSEIIGTIKNRIAEETFGRLKEKYEN